MKSFTQKGICKKIIIAFLTFVLLFQFMMPIRSEADFELPTADEVFTGMAQILAAGGDLVMGALNNFMLGTKGFGTAMISSEALENNTGSWFEPKDDNGNEVTANEPGDFEDIEVEGDPESKKVIVYVEDGTITEGAVLADSDYWEVPNLLYCPENIFGNNIAMLDVNFLNPNQYSAAVESNLDDEGNEQSRGVETAKDRNGKDSSIAHQLQQTIGTWYKAFRNIAVVALLSILVYLGIRILISSTADDKAKYKETIKDWLIALVLIFAMHIIMSFVIMIVNQINSLFININNSIYVWYEGKVAFRSNFTGVMRFLAQSNDLGNAWAYTIIYLILVAYTVSFTFQYLKRVLYIAFYTMIAPLVAITYPLDKLGDGKSQAFNKWLREYVMTMALQPIHLIIYTMVVSSAMTLSIKSPLYAIVAIGFLIPAEQFIKSLFGIESKADSGFAAGAATTAVAMNALGKMRKPIGPRNSGGGKVKKIGGSDGIDESEDKAPVIRQSGNKELESFNKSYNTDTDDKGYNSQYEVGSNERFNLQNKDGYTYIDGDENREPINFSMGDSNGYWTQDGANSTPLGSDGNAGDSEDMEENYNLDMKDLNDIEAGEDEEGMYLDDGNYDMDNPVEILDDDSQDESNLRTNDIVDLDEVEPEDGQDRIETQDIVDLDDEKTGFKDNLKGTEPEEFEVKPEEKPIISGYTSPTASNSNSKQQEGAEENTNTAEPVKFTRSLTEPEYEQEPEEDIGKNANENMYTAEPVTFTSGLGNTENKEDSNNTHEDNNEIYSVDYSKPQQPDNKPQKTPEQIQKEKEKEEKNER
ncbi:MAG: hypothetical protein IKF38_07410, partial [Clostridia bacterium]|nr:hypothetical protein [Clostridia bacterium]